MLLEIDASKSNLISQSIALRIYSYNAHKLTNQRNATDDPEGGLGCGSYLWRP